jgi:uncharacterized membrane protein YuzA (DUF378 family)
MAKGCGACQLAHWLILIGALNWGLVGIGGFAGADWNVVNMLLGGWPQLEWIVYILVGLSALVKLGNFCPACKTK